MQSTDKPLPAAMHHLPEQGTAKDALVADLTAVAAAEDAFWQTGQVSGTMYSGDDDLYALISEVFRRYSHVNVLQRDMCPSQTRFEAGLISMTADLMHGGAATDGDVCGVITGGGSESIMTAMLAYRDHAREHRGISAPEVILPSTAHTAFRKAMHYFGIRGIEAPVDPLTTEVDLDFVRDHLGANTVALVGSAGNYPYGTLDPIAELSDLAVQHGIGLHVDGCLGGFILPFGEQLGHDIPVFDFRLPGVTSISADTHKYGYGPKGTSVCLFRTRELRASQYFIDEAWQGGMYCSPGMGGSRSGGLIAATWAVMVHLGRNGYLERAKKIFDASFAMQEAVRSHPELRLMGTPWFCFSFTSDAFDVYHVNDFLKGRGWRFNGQQFPSAIHMCCTGPQGQPGVVELFRDDLAEAVAYARNPEQPVPKSGALYGGQGSRATAESIDRARLRKGLVKYLDTSLELPA